MSVSLVLILSNRLEIGSLIHQSLQLGRVADLDLRDPPLALGALVDDLGVVLQRGVALNHLARHRGQDVRGRLDRFDCSDGLAGGHFEVGAGKLDVDDVAQRFCRVIRDTDFCCEKVKRELLARTRQLRFFFYFFFLSQWVCTSAVIRQLYPFVRFSVLLRLPWTN